MLKKAIRTAQNYFPFLGEAKNHYYHFTRKYLGKVHDADFSVIARLPYGKGDLYVDVGANRGQSILAIRHYRPDAQIVSFEPNPIMFDWLTKRFGDDQRVRLIRSGLGPSAVIHKLFVPSYRGFSYDGIASFSREAVVTYFSKKTLFFYNPRNLEILETECLVDTLDHFDIAPFFIKIDVEGFEYDVLLGARQTLQKHEPILMLERYYEDGRIRPLLDGFGYREVVARSGRSGFDLGTSNGLNMILMTEKRLQSLG